MTSKEMLEVIRENKFNEVICTIPPLEAYKGITKEEMFKIIERDLEVLDILKENIVECVGDSAGNVYLKLLLHKFCNEEKYHKVKECLRNDKQRSTRTN